MAAHKKTFWQKLGYIFAPADAKGVGFFDRAILTMLGADDAWQARPNDPREKHLIDTITELSGRMGVPPPKVIVYQSDIPNAASLITGDIVVGSNLMDIMTPDQIAAVLGHELSHHIHRPRDVSVMMGVPAAYDAAAYAIRSNQQGRGGRHSQLAFSSVNSVGVLATHVLLPLAWQRSCEYEADRQGAQVTGRPDALIGGLRALEKRMAEIHGQRAHGAPRHSDSWLGPLLATHPPTELRIEQLRRMEQQAASETSPPLASR